MNRSEYRRNHTVNCMENCAEKVVDPCPDGSEEIPDRCEHSRCHRLNGSDNRSKGVGNGSPGVDEKVSNSGNDSCEKRNDAVPGIHEKCLDGSPDCIPACSKPSQHHIGDAFQRVHDVAEGVDDEIPDESEDALHAVPALFPVPSKQTDRTSSSPRRTPVNSEKMLEIF